MSGALHVLYVDDDDDIREIATLALELDPGLKVTAFSGGEAALKALDGGLRPDVVLLDVMMPDMDGPATLAAMRERSALTATPVIFITARAQAHEKDRFVALGAVGVITKPFDPMDLADDLRAILAAA